MSQRHEKKKATIEATLAETTGRPLDDWFRAIDDAGLDGFSAIVDWLKAEHGIGHFRARAIATAHRDRGDS